MLPVVDFNLRAARLNRGLPMKRAALFMNVEWWVLRDAEAGRSQPNPENAKRIADFYGLRVTEIWPVEDRTADEVTAA